MLIYAALVNCCSFDQYTISTDYKDQDQDNQLWQYQQA